MAKRSVCFGEHVYKVRSDRVDIPDLDTMPRMEALVWISRNTYRRGYSRPPSPLAGMGEVLSIRTN